MPLTANIDKSGRIVIPKSLRDELRLEPGDELALDRQGDSITLRPVRPQPRMKCVDGIWILASGGQQQDFDIVEEIRQMREERDRHNGGEAE